MTDWDACITRFWAAVCQPRATPKRHPQISQITQIKYHGWQVKKPTRKTGLSSFAKNLLQEWKRLNLPGASSIIVAVSGGADSTALLLACDELIKGGKLTPDLTIAHLDHGLRKDSKADAKFVSDLATELGYSMEVGHAKLSQKINLEEAARNARYKFFEQTAVKNGAVVVMTAHTLDDQAETVLFRLLRGSAAEGLAGVSPRRPLTEQVDLVRPFLSWARREDTEQYCRSRGVEFRHDPMNEDEAFTRVRIRKQLLPLMKSFNKRVVETLNRTAVLLGEDAKALAGEAAKLLVTASAQNIKTETPALDVQVLSAAPAAVRRRALREWILLGRGHLRRLEMVHLLAVENLLEGTKGGRTVELPGGARVVRRRGKLEFWPKSG